MENFFELLKQKNVSWCNLYKLCSGTGQLMSGLITIIITESKRNPGAVLLGIDVKGLTEKCP